MADLTLFEYRNLGSRLNRYDPRHKLAALVLFGISTMAAGVVGLAAISSLSVAACLFSRGGWRQALRSARALSLLLAVVLVVDALVTPGAEIVPGIPATVPGVILGALFVWRLSLLILVGALFSSTTSMRQLRAAVVWYLSPFPIVPAGRIATMLGLTVSLLPLTFETYEQIREAQLSRGIEGRRNPFARAAAVAVPLLIRTFSRADAIAMAMEARCYRDDRTGPRLHACGTDWLATIAAGIACALGLLVHR